MSLQQLARTTQRLTTQEFVHRTLRDAIVDGTLKAGAQVIQAELASQLEVSITPVREALRDLAAEGLVVLTPNRGTFVRALNLDEVREIYELRITLEPLMVRRTVDVIATDALSEARSLLSLMENAPDIGAWTGLNRRFHAIFGQQREASELASILHQLRAKSEYYVRLSLQAHPDRVEESNNEHTLLTELYEARDVDKVIDLTVQHLQTTLSVIEDAYGNHGSWG